MKKVLFVTTSFGTGGIMRSLQNFLNIYDRSLLEVDVFVMVRQGVYNGELHNCRILPFSRPIDALLSNYHKLKGVEKIVSVFFKSVNNLTKRRFQRVVLKKVANTIINEKRYDAVVAFSEGVPTLFVSYMKHDNKISWIHCDYKSYLKLNHGRTELRTYESMRSIVCVSEYTSRSFVSIYPSLADRTCCIYNIIDDEMMKEKAKESIEEHFDSSRFNIVSIGRIDPVKRLSIVPELARKVVDAGCDIRWYVIGPKGTNTELQLLRNNIVEYNVENIVIPLGEKANPYPYISNADLLVNTSISEACPYVINEAKILRTPVVCTDFGSAKEFIDYGKNGYYEPIEKIPTTIETLVKDPQILEGIRCNLSYFKYENRILLQKIYSLFDSKKTSSN